MISLQVPLISSNAGPGNDGVVIGNINQSTPLAVLLGESLVPLAQVLRKDATVTGATWLDLTTVATDAAAGDFAPFGAASNMSVGDAIYFRTQNDVDTHVIYFQIATPGVGTWTLSLQEWNTTTETWENVTGFADTSNALKNAAGTYRMSYTSGAEGLIRLDPESPKYIWHRLAVTALTGTPTTAPVLSRMWVADTSLSYKDVTVAHTSTNFASLPAEILPRINDCLITVHPGPAFGEDVVITRSASSNYTSTLYYLASDDTYKVLAGVSDETNMYQLAPSATERKVRWTLPTDWASKSITDKDGVVHTGYIVCMRITAIGTEGPVAPPQINCKSRAFGDANTEGVQVYAATTIKAVCIPRIGVSSSASMTLQLLNMSTGLGSSFTIPANATSLNADITDLAFAAGNRLGLAHQSGSGSLQSVEVILQ